MKFAAPIGRVRLSALAVASIAFVTAGFARGDARVPSAEVCAASSDDVRDLEKRLAKAKNRAEPELFERLAAIGDLASLEALERVLDKLSKRPALDAAYRALSMYVDAAPEAAQRARYVLARDSFGVRPKELRPLVVGSLCKYGDQALVALEKVLAEHEQDACRAIACDALAPRLLLGKTSEGLDRVLSLASLTSEKRVYAGAAGLPEELRDRPHGEVLRALVAAQPRQLLIPALAKHVARQDAARAWKLVWIELLAGIPDESATRALAGAFADEDETIALEALSRVVKREGSEGLAAFIRPLVDARSAALRRAAVEALGRLELTDAEVRALLLSLATSKDRATRMGAAAALFYVRTVAARAALYALLNDREWSVRSIALDKVALLRRADSIPHLIARMQSETGRLHHDLHGALCIITGLDLGSRAENWRRWWEREGANFEVPQLGSRTQRRTGTRRAPSRRRAQRRDDFLRHPGL